MSNSSNRPKNKSQNKSTSKKHRKQLIKSRSNKDNFIQLLLYAIGLLIILVIIFVGVWYNHPDPLLFYWSLCILIVLLEFEFFIYGYLNTKATKTKIIAYGVALIFITLFLFIFVFSPRKPSDSLNEQIRLLDRKFDEFTVPDLNSELRDSGFCLYTVIQFTPQDVNRRKYIFDIAKSEFKNRLSLFIDPNNILVFELRDNFGEIYNVKVPEYDFKYNKPMILHFEYGLKSEFSYIRLFINGSLMKQSKYNFAISLPYPVELGKEYGFSVGADINGQNNAAFVIRNILIYNATMNKSGREQNLKHFNEKYTIY